MSWGSPVPEGLVMSTIINANTYLISSDASHFSLVSGFQSLNDPETILRSWSFLFQP